MIALILLQKSAPHLIKLFLPLLGILIFIFILSSLYEWLKTKPWKKSGFPTPPDEVSDQHTNQISHEDDAKHSDQKDLFRDPLHHLMENNFYRP